MKYIFLSVSGVLNSTRYFDKLEKKKKKVTADNFIDKRALDLFSQLVSETDATVVLIEELPQFNHDERRHIVSKLKHQNITVIDNRQDYVSDDEYVSAFVDAHNLHDDIQYCILDTKNDDIYKREHQHHVIVSSGIDNKDGFTMKHYHKCLKILMGDDYIHESNT